MRPFALSHAILACCPTLLAAASQAPLPQQPPDAERTRVAEAFGRLPLYFIANQGQVDDEQVAFYVKGEDKTLFFTPGGITFALRRAAKGEEGDEPSRWTVKLDFLGANPDARPEGKDRQQAVFSYFKGRPEDWKTAIPTYGRVVYRDLWPGIDLVYSRTVNALKYEFVIRPGADSGRIRLGYRGVSGLAVAETGELNVSTPAGGFEDGVPVAWQVVDGEKKHVSMRYALGAETENGVFPYSFALGAYDATQPLILDPAILVYCGYIGGSHGESGWDIAVDGQGNAYVAGDAYSHHSSFPVTVGPDLTFNWGVVDAFVARVNNQGTALDYCGYIGGSDFDFAYGIAVDGQGNAYVTGYTSSDESSFPVTVGPDLTFNGYRDAFVAKIAAFQFTLAIVPDPLLSGQPGTFSVTGAGPNTATWLGYSLVGLGATPIPQLNVTLDLANPVQAAGPTASNAQGEVTWNLPVPPQAAGLNVWVQSAQFGKVSNVVATSV